MQKSLVYQQKHLSYQVEGSGFPVVLLHGFGEDGSIWDHQKAMLSNRHTVIVPDLPGSGASETVSTPEASTIAFYAEALLAVLQQENVEQCILLGHSMGGYITLCFAELYPQYLKAFGLVHSTAFADNAEKKQVRQRGIELIGAYGSYAFLKTTIPNLFGSYFKKEHPEVVYALIEKGNNFTGTALEQYYTAMMNRPDRTAILRDSGLPVLFVLGTDDVAAPLQDLLQQVYLPDVSYVYILEQTGHMGMVEKTTQLNQALAEFTGDICADS